MGNPLQDQLIKAGLADKKQAGKANREQYLGRKKKKTAPNRGGVEEKVRQERIAGARRNQELNKQREEEKRRHERQAQIKQLVEQNRLERDDSGGSPYHFAVEKKIHRILVPEDMIDRLSTGQLAVVRFNDGFEVVPAKTARQIADRDKEAVVSFRDK